MSDSATRFDKLLHEWDCGYVPQMEFFAVLIDCLHEQDVYLTMPRVPQGIRLNILQWATEMRAALRAGEPILSFTSSGSLNAPRCDVIERLGDWLDQHSDEWIRGEI